MGLIWWILILAGVLLLVWYLRRSCFQNCWFCNTNSVVPYKQRNSWDCATCGQYNGFDENGDYNKDIPAQYVEQPPKRFTEQGAFSTLGNQFERKSTLCGVCNRLQSIKLHQLAEFEPNIESNFDEEMKVFKDSLEEEYRLCHKCELILARHVLTQDRQLKSKILDSKLNWAKTQVSKVIPQMHVTKFHCLLRLVAFLSVVIVACCELRLFIESGQLGELSVFLGWNKFQQSYRLYFSPGSNNDAENNKTSEDTIRSGWSLFLLDKSCDHSLVLVLVALQSQIICCLFGVFYNTDFKRIFKDLLGILLLGSITFNVWLKGSTPDWLPYSLGRTILLLVFLVESGTWLSQHYSQLVLSLFGLRARKKTRLKHNSSMTNLSSRDSTPNKENFELVNGLNIKKENIQEEDRGLHSTLISLSIGQNIRAIKTELSWNDNLSPECSSTVSTQNKTQPECSHMPLIHPARLNLYDKTQVRGDFRSIRNHAVEEPHEMEMKEPMIVLTDSDCDTDEDLTHTNSTPTYKGDVPPALALPQNGSTHQQTGNVFNYFWPFIFWTLLFCSFFLNLYLVFNHTDWISRIQKSFRKN